MITIAIVYYKGVNEEYFKKSVYSALSQIGINYKINIYTDTDIAKYNFDFLNSLVIKKIPKKFISRQAKIREFIVDDIQTPYMSFWDADDIYTVDRLYGQYKKIRENNSDLCFSDFLFFDKEKIDRKTFFELIGFGERKINIYDENYIGLGIVTAKVSFLKSLKPFPDIRTLDWWVAIQSKIRKAKVSCCREVHGYYRVYKGSMSTIPKGVKKENFVKEKENKIELYRVMLKELPVFMGRYQFYRGLDIENEYKQLKSQYNKMKYKNIWGGLIKYVNQ